MTGAAHDPAPSETRHLGRVPRAAALVIVTGLVAGGLAGAVESRSLLVVGAVLLGWSQLVGL